MFTRITVCFHDMSKLAQKFVDIVVIGQGDTARLVKKILSFQTKKTHKHFAAKKPRFVSQNTIVIDGEKISAKKFLIILPQLHKMKAFTVVGEHPLPAHVDLESIDTTVKSACVIGSDSYALEQCVGLRERGAIVTLISEKQILTNYDSTVQDVMGRYLKKLGVAVHMNKPILSIEPRKGNVHVLADDNGTPVRVSADELIIAPDTVYLNDLGLGNIDDSHAPKEDTPIDLVGGNVLIVKDTPLLGLETAYALTEFLLGKRRTHIDYTPRAIYSSPELYYFSIGINEQDYFDTHLSYKKAIVKVAVKDNATTTWFIKVITSTHGRIIGIHAVLPFEYQNIDMLINLVEKSKPVSELRSSCPANDVLADTFVEIIGDLA